MAVSAGVIEMYSAANRVPVNNAAIMDRMRGGFNRWISTRFLTPGAENQAYTTNLLPVNWYLGGGNAVQGQLSINAPQVYYVQQQVPTGIAGIVHGTVRVPSLADNFNVQS